MKKLSLSVGVFLLALLASLGSIAEAAKPLRQIPMTIATALIPGKPYAFQFSLYSAPTGGTKLWGPASASLTVAADKTITYTLGKTPVFGPAVNFAQQLWVQVTGGGKTFRVPLAAAPYALWSLSSAASSVTTTAIVNGTLLDEDIDANAGIADSKLAQIASAGKVADTALSANVDLLDGSQGVTGLKTFMPTGETVPFAVEATRNGVVANLNADLLDGNEAAAFQKKYGRVAVVAKSGGDYTDPRLAMDGIADWCPARTADTPCLLKVMPGVYDIGADNSVVMQSYVDIEGSGELTTKIKGSIGTDSVPTVGLLLGADNAEARFLSVENVNTSKQYVVGIKCNSGTASLLHVTATASGGVTTTWGILNFGAAPVIRHVTATGNGGGATSMGLSCQTGDGAVLADVEATASGATTTNIGLQVSNSTTGVVMTNVTASASGTGLNGTALNTGVNVGANATLSMRSVAASAKEGLSNKGIALAAGANVAMTDVTTRAFGPNSNYGVYNERAVLAMTNVTASGQDGTGNYGLFNTATSGAYTVFADRSSFEGSTASINSHSSFTVVLGASRLAGGALDTTTGTWSCAASYQATGATYVALDELCL